MRNAWHRNRNNWSIIIYHFSSLPCWKRERQQFRLACSLVFPGWNVGPHRFVISYFNWGYAVICHCHRRRRCHCCYCSCSHLFSNDFGIMRTPPWHLCTIECAYWSDNNHTVTNNNEHHRHTVVARATASEKQEPMQYFITIFLLTDAQMLFTYILQA